MNNIGREKLFKRKLREANEKIATLEAENANLKKQVSTLKRDKSNK